MKQKNLKEQTGTGAGASFTPGSGEQHNGIVKKKKRIKESVSYTPEKREAIYKEASGKLKENEATFKKYANYILGQTFGDLLEDRSKIDNLIRAGELLEKKFTKINEECWDAAEAYQEENGYSDPNYKKLDELATKYDDMSQWANWLKDLIDGVELTMKHFNDDKQFLNIIK